MNVSQFWCWTRQRAQFCTADPSTTSAQRPAIPRVLRYPYVSPGGKRQGATAESYVTACKSRPAFHLHLGRLQSLSYGPATQVISSCHPSDDFRTDEPLNAMPFHPFFSLSGLSNLSALQLYLGPLQLHPMFCPQSHGRDHLSLQCELSMIKPYLS